MQRQTVRISTLVIGAVLSYMTSGCSGGGVSAGDLDAAGAAGAADVSSADAQGGVANDSTQRAGRIPADEVAWSEYLVTLNALGGGGPCPACKPRVAEPLPRPTPEPAPFKAGAAETAR